MAPGREGPRVRRLAPGGSRIRTASPALAKRPFGSHELTIRSGDILERARLRHLGPPAAVRLRDGGSCRFPAHRDPELVGAAAGERRTAAGSAFRDGWPWRVVFAELPDGIPDPPLCRRAIVIAGRRRPRVSSARSAPS